MTITAAGLKKGNFANNDTGVTLTFGTVSVGQLIVVCGMKFSPNTGDDFALGDIGTAAGTTATLGSWQLDRSDGGNDGGGYGCFSAIWSNVVTSTAGGTQLNLQISGATTGSYLLIAAEAFNGTWTSGRVESSNGQIYPGDNFTSATTGNVTSAGAALFVACLQDNDYEANTFTEDAAFTLIYEDETATNDNGSAIYRIVSSGTTDAGDWAIAGGNSGYSASAVVYKEIGAAAHNLTAEQGSYALTGQTNNFVGPPRSMTAGYDNITVTGIGIDLKFGLARYLVADQGTITTSGQDVTYHLGKKLVSNYNTYSTTGQTVGLYPSYGIHLTAAQGTYLVVGSDAYRDIEINGDYNSYSVSGQAAGLYASNRKLTAAQGTYTMTGVAANLIPQTTTSYIMAADGNTYSVVGQDDNLVVVRFLKAAPEGGQYVITGHDVATPPTLPPVVDDDHGGRRRHRHRWSRWW